MNARSAPNRNKPNNLTNAEKTDFYRSLAVDLGTPFSGKAIFLPSIGRLTKITGYSTGFFYNGGDADANFKKYTGLTVVHSGGLVLANEPQEESVSVQDVLPSVESVAKAAEGLTREQVAELIGILATASLDK